MYLFVHELETDLVLDSLTVLLYHKQGKYGIGAKILYFLKSSINCAMLASLVLLGVHFGGLDTE